MKTLLAIVSADDPYLPGLAGDLRLKGPILSLLQHRPMDRVILAAPFGRKSDAEAVGTSMAGSDVEILELPGASSDSAAIAGILKIASSRNGANLFALADDAAAESAIAAAGIPLTLLRVGLSANPADDVIIEEVPVHRASMMVRDPRGLYAVDEGGRVPLATVVPAGKRNAKNVARTVGLVGEHPLLMREIEKAAAVSEHPVPILIQGETGTGKGVIAHFIHEMSDRAQGPLVAINCGALPEQLAESLLFGHVKGSFTGAHADQAGKFVLADNGTIFLDEIGELPLTLQPKLLRVLEDGLVEPLGASRGKKVNVRVIAATHLDLKKAVAEKKFREDLFYRLCYATITLPPLRDRRSDIQLLALHILGRLNRRLQRPKSFSVEALAHLESQYWRGNVRDLENAIGRSLILSRADVLKPADLVIDEMTPVSAVQTPEPHDGFSLEDHLTAVRADLIEKALRKSGGNQSAAARLLGLSAQAVHKFTQSRP